MKVSLFCKGLVGLLTISLIMVFSLSATPLSAQFVTNTPISLPTATPNSVSFPTAAPTLASTLTAAPAVSASPTARITATLSVTVVPQLDHAVFARPIERSDALVDYVNRVYPYGGTQFGQFEVHLGVDMQNSRFTPILAAGDGVVYYAGADMQRLFGPYNDYYGNLVVIQHDLLSAEGLPVYTLYGHMQAVSVTTGQTVSVGDVIGTVGDSGIAFGPHLHFEVRVGNPEDYLSTRNPDLWIKPYFGFGTLAGRLETTQSDWRGLTVLVRSIEGRNRETYTYGGDRVNSDPSWLENFTLGDLPEGDYEVIVSDRSGRIYFRQPVTIQASATTFVEVMIDR